MPLNGLISGIQSKISFIDADGVQNFTVLESFSAKEDATVSKYIAMDGTVRHEKFHSGWSGTCMFERNDNFLDRYIAAQESAYYLGLNQLPLTITQTITENNGDVTQYQYINAVLVLDDAGTYTGTDIAKQSVSYQASRRLSI